MDAPSVTLGTADSVKAEGPEGRHSATEAAAPVERVPPAVAVLVAWLAVALWAAVTIARIPLPPEGTVVRVLHHAVDLGHTLLIALLVAAGAALYRRWRRRRWWIAVAIVAVLAAGVAQLVLLEDVSGLVERLGFDPDDRLVTSVAAAAAALAVPAALAVGMWFARPRLRWAALAVGLAAIVVNTNVLPRGYAGIHLVIATCGATLVAAALNGAPLPRPFRRKVPPVVVAIALLLVSAVAVASVAVEPSSALQSELLRRDDTALLVPWLRWAQAPSSIGGVEIPRDLRRAFERREGRPDLPPTPNRLLPKDGIVILITIDALRADLMRPEHREVVPTLNQIRERSVYFSQARSAGSDTRVSLAALFAGRYLSMLKWSKPNVKKPTFEKDLKVRLPEVLNERGVRTVHFVSLNGMLLPKFGVVRGFAEEHLVRADLPDDGFPGEDLTDQAIRRLKRDTKGPLFIYMHYIEPHEPYHPHGPGEARKSNWERYLGEVKYTDAQIARLYRTVYELGLEKRTAFIVSADHGEGFGENGVRYHNKTVYDVVVHVPLMIQLPSVAPREVADAVGMADLGPTVLDLFQAPTPGFWMADSLVPILKGERTNPGRVMAMETRIEYGVVFPDLFKVIVHARTGTQEIYDLGRDPEEKQNLRDSLAEEGDRRVALARAFMKIHAGRHHTGREF